MSVTESVESVESLSQEIAVDLSIVLAALKEFDCADLFEVIKVATREAEKQAKRGFKPKADPSAPKKATPKQFQKSTCWINFTMKHAMENGWEQFIIENTKKGEAILMDASEETENGEHLYPNGKPMILTHAMSLAKQRWSQKTKTGTHEELYNEFSAEFEAHKAEEPVEEAEEEVPKPALVLKTAEQKAAELAAKKAELAEKAAIAKAAREAAAEAKKKEKAELAAKEKAEKAAAKAAVKAAVKVPAAALKAPIRVVTTKVVAKPATAVKKFVDSFTCPNDGQVHEWTFKGTKYLRNFDNQIWLLTEEGECGDWCGVFADGSIDDSVEEPSF